MVSTAFRLVGDDVQPKIFSRQEGPWVGASEVPVKVYSEANGGGGVTKIATFDKVTKDKVNVMMEEESRSVSVTYDNVISRMLTKSTCIPTVR